MKAQLATLLLLTTFAFAEPNQVAPSTNPKAAESATSENSGKIKLLTLVFFPSGRILAMYKNTSGNPIKAFKGRWFVLNDFNEISQSGEIHFTSDMIVIGSRNFPLGGYIIPPNGIIYIFNEGNTTGAMVGNVASDAFGNLDDLPPTYKKRFKVGITDVIFDERHPVTKDGRSEPRLGQEPQRTAAAVSNEPKEQPSPASPGSSLPVPSPTVAVSNPPRTCTVVGLAADDYLNVRSAPAMNSDTKFRLSNGQRVQIRGDSVFNGETEWIPITVDAQQGWVRGKFLKPEFK